MNVIPKLNLNDNPRVAENFSLNDAYNIILSKDNTINNEYSFVGNTVIHNAIIKYIGNDNFNIIYCIPCNVELVIFVHNKNNNKFIIFRYNENKNACYAIINNFEYFGGKLVGDFTYNKDNLIISIAEYVKNSTTNIPLKTINLGKFPEYEQDIDFINPDDKLALYDNRLHPICPEVIIPKVNIEYVNGNCYKGWYYIFIRYKISNNTYTKWLNTNESVFIDEYHKENIIDYHISKYWNLDDENRKSKEAEEDKASTIEIQEYISNNNDISSNSFNLIFNNLDYKYSVFQVGLICLSKSYSKGFKSEDIKIYKNEDNEVIENIVKFNSFSDYSVADIIKIYSNYYNVKTLHSYNNRLYIGNYNEYEKTLDVSNIKLKLDFYRKDSAYNYIDKRKENNLNINTLSENNIINPQNNDIIEVQIRHGEDIIHAIKNPLSFIDKNNNITNIKLDNTYTTTIGVRLNLLHTENGQTTFIPAGKYYHTFRGNNLVLLIGYEIEWHYDNFETGAGKYIIKKTGRTSYKSFCLVNEGSSTSLLEDCAPWLKFITDDENIKKENLLYNYSMMSDWRSFFFIAISKINGEGLQYSNYGTDLSDIDFINNGTGESIPFYNKLGTTISIRSTIFDNKFNNKWYYKDTDINLVGDIEGDSILYNKVFICNPYSQYEQWFLDYAKDILINQPDNPETPEDKEKIGNNYTNSITSSCGLSTNEYYSFYIHFINKYGEITRGYPIGMFNINESIIGSKNSLFDLEEGESHIEVENDNTFTNNYAYVDKVTNKLGLLLISLKYKYNNFINDNSFVESDKFYKYYFKFTINEIPYGYVGYFMSCEKLDKTLLYAGLGEITEVDTVNFYNDRLNFDDTINFNFNKLIISGCHLNPSGHNSFNHVAVQTISDYEPKEYDIIEKNVKVCDSFNNIGRSTKLVLKVNNSDFIASSNNIIDDCHFCCLINDDNENKYCNNNKALIPCSQINYSIDIPVIGNPKSVFVTNNTILYYIGNFYNTGLNIFQKPQDPNRSIENIHAISFKYKDYVPFESVCFNNKPAVIFFPFVGLSNTSENLEQSFKTGYIVEAKNTIDLFQIKQISYDTLYPTILANYDKNIIYTDTFNKTVRRSNVIQDESSVNAWRKFEIEQYKNINENKGSIIKIFGFGYLFIVHTEHSMFMFRNVDSLKSSNNENKEIQLASIDIWDVNYQEFFTSKLGYGGITDEHHGIVDTFGYIWYDSSNNKLYRIDGDNKFENIDYLIRNYLDIIQPNNIYFANDKEHNRLIMSLYKNNNFIDTLSYNYNINSFVSRHSYQFNQAYNTKNKVYVLGQNILNTVNSYNCLDYGTLININNSDHLCYIDIIVNTSYEIIKFLENIKYKLNEIKVIETGYNKRYNKIKNIYYPANYIRIFNDINDTGEINVVTTNPNKNINKVENYNKPYWNLGNWNFNCIRNKIAEYINNTIQDREVNRFYGNYFIIRFIFDTANKIEFENLDCEFSTKRIGYGN